VHDLAAEARAALRCCRSHRNAAALAEGERPGHHDSQCASSRTRPVAQGGAGSSALPVHE
jgi:hypothetical protein